MATTNRPYLITDTTSQTTRLVQATSQAQARNWVARHQYSVKVASANDVIEAFSKGITAEIADAEQAEVLEVTGAQA